MDVARIGLVLGAGGYPGFPFQLATLGAVQDYLGIDLRDAAVMVGTSVGALVALLLRAGFSVDDLEAHARDRELSPEGHRLLHEVLDPPGRLPPRFPTPRLPRPLVTGAPPAWWGLAGRGRSHNWLPGAAALLAPRGRTDQGVFARAADSLHPVWPEQDTWIVAMRVADGERRVFGRDVAATPGEAATATSSIPGYFRPVEIAGEDHVDAGALSSTHADLLAGRRDLDLVVVVPPLGASDPARVSIDAPLRWLVNAQLKAEARTVRATGIPVAVLSPPVEVVRALQGDPIRMSRVRRARILDRTESWARREAGHVIHEALVRSRRGAG